MIKFLTIILLILLILLYPYITFRKPIMPICIKCHQTLNENSFNTRGWKYVNNKIACIDHAFIDGKILHKNFNNKLDESLLNKPPSEYFYSKRIDELYIDGYTKYEVFCYYLGKEIITKYPKLIKFEHIVKSDKKSSLFLYYSFDYKFCKTPINQLSKIKENNKCDNIFINFIKSKMNLPHTILINDWRWFYPYVTLDKVNVDINGKDKKLSNFCVVRNFSHYYAICHTN